MRFPFLPSILAVATTTRRPLSPLQIPSEDGDLRARRWRERSRRHVIVLVGIGFTVRLVT
jgi:hypothetical protein